MIYFKHSKTQPKQRKFREMKITSEQSRKFHKLMFFSLSCLLVIALLNVTIFLYLTNKGKTANDIAQNSDRMEAEIIVIQGQIHQAESISRISNDANLSGLSKNTSVKVLTIGNQNIGLR